MNKQKLIKQLLTEIGENPDREGLIKTPDRVSRMLDFLMSGYDKSAEDILASAIYHEDNDDMVIVQDIEFYSMCEHHMMPFFGKAHVAYIPNGKIVGLSKIARAVDVFARRLQVQERLTRQVADTVNKVLQPKGVAVVMEAVHMCMTMRGVQKQNSITKTSSMLGVFRRDERTRIEFLSIIGKKHAGI